MYNSPVYSITPVVLDLDGNGIDLLSVDGASAPLFDMDGDGAPDKAGWVGADDALLAIDRDGDGLITKGEEISFTGDLPGAVSDLEGLHAFDSNNDGLVDARDDRFVQLRVWQDLDQDGVSDEGEVTNLADRGIAAIDLSLTRTGASLDNLTDNVVYGTGRFIRNDGSSGTAGDVVLAYRKVEPQFTIEPAPEPQPTPESVQSATAQNGSGYLGPIVIDLDRNGISLLSRSTSTATFDTDRTGVRQKTGWVGAGDGLLVLDRNHDGAITDASEISFIGDLPGAVSDLEGLRAFDTNQNGLFDEGDAQFAEFRIWRDGDQNGISRASELKPLSSYGITAINLTRQVTGQSAEGATDNVVVAIADVLHADGATSAAGDVFLAYDADPAKPVAQPQTRRLPEPPESGTPNWSASGLSRRTFEVASQQGSDWAVADQLDDVLNAGFVVDGGSDEQWSTTLAAGHQVGMASALDGGVGVLDRSVLQMVAAISTFNTAVPGSLERFGQKHRPKGMEYLTALPDLHPGNSLGV
jgi:hypothetical protein